MLADARRRIAGQQSELVRALGTSALDHSVVTVPPGFDAKRLRALAQSLARKRADAVARIWPELREALGAAAFGQAFDAYAAVWSIPTDGGATADGREFIAWYGSKHTLPDEFRWRAFITDLAFARSLQGMRRRRGVALRIAWLRHAGRVAMGLRLPWLGIVWGSLPVPCRRRSR